MASISKKPRSGYVINPKTGKEIKIGGPTFKKFSRVKQQQLIREAEQAGFQAKQKCPPEEVWREKTQRCIKIGGKTWKTLSEEEKNQLLISADKESLVIRGKGKRGLRTRKPVVPRPGARSSLSTDFPPRTPIKRTPGTYFETQEMPGGYTCTQFRRKGQRDTFCTPTDVSKKRLTQILDQIGFGFTPEEIDQIYAKYRR